MASSTLRNPYLYENLVSNLKSQIEYWNIKASKELNPVIATRLRDKAEGLGYALRLLHALEPEFSQTSEVCR